MFRWPFILNSIIVTNVTPLYSLYVRVAISDIVYICDFDVLSLAITNSTITHQLLLVLHFICVSLLIT